MSFTDMAANRLFVVRGNSMEPTFGSGNYLLVNRRAYVSAVPSRGDVVVVRDPRVAGRSSLKRVVGLPGETVKLCDGMVFTDGDHLAEPYLGGLPATLGLDNRAWKLGANETFVMGDNRAHSTDSRDFGPVHIGLIVGKAWLRCWPPSQWRRL